MVAGVDKLTALLRRHPRAQLLSSLLCLLMILAGIATLLVLPRDDYSRKTYISENALLPGQVQTYFTGFEHNVFRAYRHEVADLAELPSRERSIKLADLLRSAGLKTDIQRYHYPGYQNSTIEGENVYGLLEGPRADQTEAIVMIASWKNMDEEINYSGVSLVISLAKYFRRWSMWSKNIIFLIPSDSRAGPQAWVDAYHNQHDPATVDSLTLKSGQLQAAVAIDYTANQWGRHFGRLHIQYDGTNGQLPNLDLINTATLIANHRAGMSVSIQGIMSDPTSYSDKLQTIVQAMKKQAVGFSSGPHSPFMAYHVDAITLKAVGSGWHDEISLGRTVEGLFRSLNNLLEHLHQSFFFYILTSPHRFVSIGAYLPAAMAIATSFTFMAIFQWIRSQQDGKPTVITWPAVWTSALYCSGAIPLVLFRHFPPSTAVPLLKLFSALSIAAAWAIAVHLAGTDRTSPVRPLKIFHSFTLLLHGMLLATLATANFSLATFIGLITAPFCFMDPALILRRESSRIRQAVTFSAVSGWIFLSPVYFFNIMSKVWKDAINETAMLTAKSSATAGFVVGNSNNPLVQLIGLAEHEWRVHRVRTFAIGCLVWWPAWMAGMVIMMLASCKDLTPARPDAVQDKKLKSEDTAGTAARSSTTVGKPLEAQTTPSAS